MCDVHRVTNVLLYVHAFSGFAVCTLANRLIDWLSISIDDGAEVFDSPCINDDGTSTIQVRGRPT